jgi:hypothetical protein
LRERQSHFDWQISPLDWRQKVEANEQRQRESKRYGSNIE